MLSIFYKVFKNSFYLLYLKPFRNDLGGATSVKIAIIWNWQTPFALSNFKNN